MKKNINHLINLGFKDIGIWSILDDELSYSLVEGHKARCVLYSFVVNDDVKYIGKTTMELQRRLYGYKKPGPTQITNIKNNVNIKKELNGGKEVGIYALIDAKPLLYKNIEVNLAAGLEDYLINKLVPDWNHLGKR